MSSRKTAGRRATTKKRAQRATSNVFAMFDQAQIQEFKEAFNMIDQNRDGFVDKEDLHDMLASLGKDLLRTVLRNWYSYSIVIKVVYLVLKLLMLYLSSYNKFTDVKAIMIFHGRAINCNLMR